MLGALKETINLNWTARIRFAILVGDAPPHGSRFHGFAPGSPYDAHRDGKPSDPTLESLVQGFLEAGTPKGRVDLLLCPVRDKVFDKFQDAFVEANMAWYARKYSEPLKREQESELVLRRERPAALNTGQGNMAAMHIVFVLDDSGSMRDHWQNLVRAYQLFVNTRAQANQGVCFDLVSVVQFSCTVSVVCSQAPVASAPASLAFRSGGTDFSIALKAAAPLITGERTGLAPVLVFMSDGGDGSGSDTRSAVANLCSASPKLIVHTIAFGGGADATTLKNMAAAANITGRDNRGEFHAAADGLALVSCFGKIASEAGVPEGLVATFAARLSQSVANKLMLDCL